MDENTLKLMLVACVVIGVCMFFIARYIGEKNAQRHQLKLKRSLLTGDEANSGKSFSPWSELILGCIYIIFSIVFFEQLQGSFERKLLLAILVVIGLSFLWHGIKNLKNEKT